ncbi:MAG: hypothetical protein LBT46_06440 [Planctomycetaceae bacterium]|jgi:hypothetical protein|nr:hypothetical protein [Planctomycetaceae bacterium]
MLRYCFVICLLLFAAGSSGCKMCCSPYDYCVPATINREDDFRGCGPNYRAGSVFRDADCRSCGGSNDSNIVLLNTNAGNFGRITPVSARAAEEQNPSATAPLPAAPQLPQKNRPAIAKPPAPPVQKPRVPIDINLNDPFRSQGVPLPSIDELLKKNNAEPPIDFLPAEPTAPVVPVTPPSRVPPNTSDVETMPFVESEPLPAVQNEFSPQAATGEPAITIETLKKLDPTATDIKILNVEDSAVAP